MTSPILLYRADILLCTCRATGRRLRPATNCPRLPHIHEKDYECKQEKPESDHLFVLTLFLRLRALNAEGTLTGKRASRRRKSSIHISTAVTRAEVTLGAELLITAIADPETLGGMCDVSPLRVTLGAGFSDAGAVHATRRSLGERHESVRRVNALLAVLAWSTRSGAVARVGRGIDATVVEEEGRGTKVEHSEV